MASTESLEKQPCAPQTLYEMTQAPGAMPLIRPRSMPSGSAVTPGSPAAVLEVWVP